VVWGRVMLRNVVWGRSLGRRRWGRCGSGMRAAFLYAPYMGQCGGGVSSDPSTRKGGGCRADHVLARPGRWARDDAGFDA